MSEVPTTVEEPQAPLTNNAAVDHNPVHDATNDTKPVDTSAVAEEPSTAIKPSEAEATIVGGEPTAVPGKEDTLAENKSEAAVEATPASEGVLGYKAPALIPKFRFVEHFFWLDDAPSSLETLSGYVRGKESKATHHNAAWAQETGKGLLFFTKRAEDRPSPVGIINLSEITVVTLEGSNEFSFRANGHKHTFQAANNTERQSWVVAIEKKAGEAKGLQKEITGSQGYKNHLETIAKAPVIAAATKHENSSAREPKKSLDAATATNGVEKDAAGVAAVDGVTEEEKAKKAEETKSRSQSRKRNSVFGLFGKKEDKDEQKELKKEEKAEKKEEKKEEKEVAKEIKNEEKAEKKAEKEEVKHEKELEKEQKKEEAKATHEPSKAAEAGAAAVGVAVPTAVIAAEEKKHDNKEESATTTPTTEKKSKRASIFGGLFAKKDVTSPTSEKTEKDVGPSVPAKDSDVLPVSETAPKLEEPIDQKPIDTAAVTAPVDTVQTPTAVDENPKDTTAAETAGTPAKEKKSGFKGFIKKAEAVLEGKKEEKKEEKVDNKEEKAAENISKDPVAAAAVDAPTATTETTAPTTEESRPAVDNKRRSSLFGGLGTIKKKNQSDSTTDAEAAPAEAKREKSPLPSKIGSLFRRPSRAVKPEEKKEATTADTEATPATETTAKDESALTNGTTTGEGKESAIVGDIVPDNLHSTFHDAVTTAPEVQASA